MSSVQDSGLWTDNTRYVVNGEPRVKVGSLREWAAYIKAGYMVNDNLNRWAGDQPSYSVHSAAPELQRYLSALRTEEATMGTTDEEYLFYVNSHADWFSSLRDESL